jgi:hypothetical protein
MDLVAKPNTDGLLGEVTCPVCWATFKPYETLAIAEHAELSGDPLVGADQQQRFLPTRFTISGDPLDARGLVCRHVACPHCHLRLPRGLLEHRAVFVSVVGNLDSGKSFYVTSLFWTLRRLFTAQFGIRFTDADPELNQSLIDNEEKVFLSAEPDKEVVLGDLIEKTHAGFRSDLHYQTSHNGQRLEYVKPFMFLMAPLERHPSFQKPGQHGRIICTYDQSGEDFRPGRDSASRPVTRHILRSHFILFLYDPTQDARFRESLQGDRAYPAVARTQTMSRQEVLVRELAVRYRRLQGLGEEARYERPFLVVVTKADVWGHLVPGFATRQCFRIKAGQQVAAMDLGDVEETSRQVRNLLERTSPEFIAAVDSFAAKPVFVPVSSLGVSPDSKGSIRRRDIRPAQVEAPFLYGLCHSAGGLVPMILPAKPRLSSQNVPLSAVKRTGT